MIMDRDELRKKAEGRRISADVKPSVRHVWNCEFCARDFQTESGFMKHHCLERERLDELKSPMGQAAYSYYSEWMKLKKRSVPPIDRFMTSRQYNYFLKFSKFAEKTAIPNVSQFINLMVETDTAPVLWCRDTTFALYLTWYDNAYPPISQFMDTYDVLLSYSNELHISVKNIFGAIGSSALAKLIRRRKISPWYLVVSSDFMEWLKTLPSSERDLVAESINFGAFAKKMKSSPSTVSDLQEMYKELHA